MRRCVSFLMALSLFSGCGKGKDEPVSLTWSYGDSWHVAASYRVAEISTPQIPSSLEVTEEPEFGEFWSDDVIWNYQVIEADYQPDANDELHHFAVKHDGSIAELAVIRAHLD
ncbi:MAG: hypothetical protein HN348_32070, partial [Proteobacteria bacterium]|nr:hypothetical protein [Pseudomonadota bacterium]